MTMEKALATRTIWDFWAPRYDRLWVQRVSLGPTRRLVLEHVAEAAPGARRFLDLGCGIGQLARELADLHPENQVTAIDPALAMVERGRADHRHPRVEYLHGYLEDVPLDRPFDVITSTHSLPYIPDGARAMARLKQLLAPGGRVVIVHANTENLWDRLVLAFVELTTTKARYRSAKELRALMCEAGMTPGAVKPLPKAAFFMPSIQLVEGLR